MLVLMCALAIAPAACRAAEQPEIVVVEGTFTVARSPSEGRGAQQFCDKVETALSDAKIPFTLATEEQVEEGILSGHKLAIFPYSAFWSDAEQQKVVEFINSGGKLFAFYTVPPPVAELLGVEGLQLKRADYEGQYSEMRFPDDRPPGFPSVVHQTSGNIQVCEPAGGARAIAMWHDREGKPTSAPAVILSENGVYMSHVLHSGNMAEQSMLVLAVVGHFLPHVWEDAVAGSIAAVPEAAEVDSLEALRQLTESRRPARRLVQQAGLAVEQAREKLAVQEYQQALAEAGRAQTLAQDAVAATYGSRDGEFRGVWHGGGAEKDWEAIMTSLEDAGFTAILPLMCTGNHAYYPSDVLPQTGERDELALCLKAARRHNIEVHVWRVNWAMLGGSPERRQQFIDEGRTMVSVSGEAMGADPATGSTPWMCPSHPGNREIEKQAMLELTGKYHPAGIHFDYMRFPSRNYCYCDRCRRSFEEAYGVSVRDWPDDCFAGGPLFEEYKRFRKELQTSLVKEIAEASREIDPNVRISLAARSALPGAPENDGQDWPTWCRDRYLDFVCPMDYSGHDDARLAQWLRKQLDTLAGCVPLYAGLGVTYRTTSLANAVRASKQISIARAQGADGFLIFSYNDTFTQFITGLRRGTTSRRVTVMPHHHPQVRLKVGMPSPPDHLPANTWPPGADFEAAIRVSGSRDCARIAARCDLQTTDGKILRRGKPAAVDGATWRVRAQGGGAPGGTYQWAVEGTVEGWDGQTQPFIVRSTPWRIATPEEIEELRRRAEAPRFETEGVHVGVLTDGYGSQAILEALRAASGIEGQPLYQLSPEHVGACQVVVVPQRLPHVTAVFGEAREPLRGYVRTGGGLVVTHDAVGMRQHQPVFPELCIGGSGPARVREAVIAAAHPLTAGLAVGQTFSHSYSDHIPVIAKGNMQVVVADAQGNAVVAAAAFGQGRYVANGMCTGLGAGDADHVPEGAEKTILLNAVRWAAKGTTGNR
jgi:uncharacterized lipoprotein YddW (UPF0748 family)